MKELIFDYMASQGIYISDEAEQKRLEKNIDLFLLENGVRECDKSEYYAQFIMNRLKLINKNDMKEYFRNYQTISNVYQIVMEYKADIIVSEDKKSDLRQYLKTLYECGLGTKYIPEPEVKLILLQR